MKRFICSIALILLFSFFVLGGEIDKTIPIVKYSPLNYGDILSTMKTTEFKSKRYVDLLKKTKERENSAYKRLLEAFPLAIIQNSKCFILDLHSLFMSGIDYRNPDSIIKYLGVIDGDEVYYLKRKDSKAYTLSDMLISEFGSIEGYISQYLDEINLACRYHLLNETPEISKQLSKQFLYNSFAFYADTYPTDLDGIEKRVIPFLKDAIGYEPPYLISTLKRSLQKSDPNKTNRTMYIYSFQNNKASHILNVDLLEEFKGILTTEEFEKLKLAFQKNHKETRIAYRYLLKSVVYFKSRMDFPTDVEEFIMISDFVFNTESNRFN